MVGLDVIAGASTNIIFFYPSGHDGAILSPRDYLSCPERKIFPKAKQQILYLPRFFGQYQWLDIVLGFFFPVSLWTSTPSRFINTQKKKEPAILITRLVNNLHLFMEVAKSLMSQKKVKRTSKLCQN